MNKGKRARYYYVDIYVNDRIEQYKNAKEFYEGLFWNRRVAKEYGDDVPTAKQLKNLFKRKNVESDMINGATFLKLTTKDLEDWGYDKSYLEGELTE